MKPRSGAFGAGRGSESACRVWRGEFCGFGNASRLGAQRGENTPSFWSFGAKYGLCWWNPAPPQ